MLSTVCGSINSNSVKQHKSATFVNANAQHKIEYLAFSGGGFKGYIYEGVLQSLDTQFPTLVNTTLKGFVGTSIGAFLSLFLSMRATVPQIQAYITENKLNLIHHLDVSHFLTTNSITDGQVLETFVRGAIVKIMGAQHTEITFEQLFILTKKELCVGVFNVSQQRFEYHSHTKTPNYKVATSVQASMSIPGVFSNVYINGDVCVDGGLLCNTPLDYFPIEKTLVFVLYTAGDRIDQIFVNPPRVNEKEENNNHVEHEQHPFSLTKIMPTCYMIMNLLLYEILIQTLKQYSADTLDKHVVFLDVQDAAVLKLNDDPKLRQDLSASGLKYMNMWLTRHKIV